MEDRARVGSGVPWEDQVGYSRAVRVGSSIFVSGTTASDPDGAGPIGGDDPAEQAREAIRRIDQALRQLGSGLEDVVRTRIYVKDIGHWPEIGKAHAEPFGEIKPASTMVEVSSLISPDLLVEIEADAVTR